jgi:hypothetical protein
MKRCMVCGRDAVRDRFCSRCADHIERHLPIERGTGPFAGPGPSVRIETLSDYARDLRDSQWRLYELRKAIFGSDPPPVEPSNPPDGTTGRSWRNRW